MLELMSTFTALFEHGALVFFKADLCLGMSLSSDPSAESHASHWRCPGCLFPSHAASRVEKRCAFAMRSPVPLG